LPEVGVLKKVQTEPVFIDEVVLVTAALALDLLLEEVVVERGQLQTFSEENNLAVQGDQRAELEEFVPVELQDLVFLDGFHEADVGLESDRTVLL